MQKDFGASPCDLGMFLGEGVEGDGGDDVLLEAHQLQDGARDEEVRLPRVAALHVEVCHHAAEPGAVGGVQKVVARLRISGLICRCCSKSIYRNAAFNGMLVQHTVQEGDAR